jgi:polyisoprenoid-binding protein YceI
MPQALTRRTLLAGALTSLATRVFARARAYELVAAGSRVAFVFTASGARQTGTVPVQSADIIVDTTNLARSRATVTADVRKISSGLMLVTQAIKSAELLNADAHPIVTFQSTRIRLGARGRISEGAEIDGNLTLRGVTRPITLKATLSRPAGTPPDDLSILFIQLNGSLNRRDFGATGFATLAEDRVDLDIRAEIRARA